MTSFLTDFGPVIALVCAGCAVLYGIVDRRGRLFAGKFDPKKQQPFIVSLPDLDHPEQARAVVDPNLIDPSGHTATDPYPTLVKYC